MFSFYLCVCGHLILLALNSTCLCVWAPYLISTLPHLGGRWAARNNKHPKPAKFLRMPQGPAGAFTPDLNVTREACSSSSSTVWKWATHALRPVWHRNDKNSNTRKRRLSPACLMAAEWILGNSFSERHRSGRIWWSVYSVMKQPTAVGTTPGQEPGKHNWRSQKRANDVAAANEMQKASALCISLRRQWSCIQVVRCSHSLVGCAAQAVFHRTAQISPEKKPTLNFMHCITPFWFILICNFYCFFVFFCFFCVMPLVL